MTNKMLTRLSLAALLAACNTLRAATPPIIDDRLPEAVQRNDRAAVQSLLLQHVSVDSAEGDGTTALHWAAYNDNLPLAKMLLAAHADVHVTTRLEAITPLMMACTNGSAPMIDLLLAHGASANETNSLGTTALMLAAASGNAAAVQTLLDHGADPNATEKTHGQTALDFAANFNRSEVISLLIAHHADPNVATRVMPITRAPRGGGFGAAAPAKPADTTAKAKEPAEAAKEEDATEAKEEPTTAAPAASGGRRRAAAAATETTGNGAAVAVPRPDRGATSIGGMTPLLFAARQGSTEAVKSLIAGGAKIDEASGSEKTTPLVLAIANGHFDTARVLVEAGADTNLANVMGVTPLYATIDVQWAPHEWSPEPVVAQEHTSYLELMSLLLAHHADPNARLGRKIWSRALSQDATWVDPAGATAFWRAAQADDLTAMKLLVTAGADPNIPTKAGVTPMMVASGLGWGMNYSVNAPGNWIDSINYCIQQGNDPNAHADNGFTALYGASFVGNNDIIKFLVSKGAKADGKDKAGDSAADMANGPFAHSIPHPDTVALLESLGSPNSHNCRSDQCVVAPMEDRHAANRPADTKDEKAPEPATKTPPPTSSVSVTITKPE